MKTGAQLSGRTKVAVGVLVALGGFFQVQAVHDALLVFGHAHPHWAGLIGAATTIATLLHNPEVQHCLEIDSPGEE